MAKPQHRTPEYKQAKARLALVVRAGEAYCVEPICKMPSRFIPPTTPPDLWHVCHDPSGTVITGPGHRRCNLSEAARRGNRMRRRTAGDLPAPTARRTSPTSTAGRWQL